MKANNEVFLGVNIDHVATLRQARGTRFPEPIQAALTAEEAGADSITLHLREDRRHIQDRDVEILHATLQTHMNLEMAATSDMADIACRVLPQDCCLVPERRAELTTEGGLDVIAQKSYLTDFCARLNEAGLRVSLFVDANPAQLDAARDVGAPVVELHTGHYADAATRGARGSELEKIERAVRYGLDLGLHVNAGHGLDYHNVKAIAAIQGIEELNIGHAIIARAIFSGLYRAVRDMKRTILETARVAPDWCP